MQQSFLVAQMREKARGSKIARFYAKQHLGIKTHSLPHVASFLDPNSAKKLRLKECMLELIRENADDPLAGYTGNPRNSVIRYDDGDSFVYLFRNPNQRIYNEDWGEFFSIDNYLSTQNQERLGNFVGCYNVNNVTFKEYVFEFSN